MPSFFFFPITLNIPVSVNHVFLFFSFPVLITPPPSTSHCTQHPTHGSPPTDATTQLGMTRLSGSRTCPRTFHLFSQTEHIQHHTTACPHRLLEKHRQQ